jgi:Flp pilus assembly protein TadG
VLTRLRRLRRDRRSTAAMEFALVATPLVILMLGVYELCNAAIVYEEVQNAAHSIPASASNLAVQSDTGATSLTYQQIQLAASEIWAEIPELRTGLQNGTYAVTVTSVTFIPTLPPTPPKTQTVTPTSSCNPSKSPQKLCTYTPTVVWSVAYTGGKSGRTPATALRSCTGAPTAKNQANATVYYATTPSYVLLPGGLNSYAPQSTKTAASTVATWTASDLTSLPTWFVANPDPILAPPSPILVVDVHLKYTSVLGLFIHSGVDFYGTGFFPVRSVQAATAGSSGSTALSLSQQFTTLVEDSSDESLSGAPTSSYCVNTSNYLATPAES